jgi:hypothetical protein
LLHGEGSNWKEEKIQEQTNRISFQLHWSQVSSIKEEFHDKYQNHNSLAIGSLFVNKMKKELKLL